MGSVTLCALPKPSRLGTVTEIMRRTPKPFKGQETSPCPIPRALRRRLTMSVPQAPLDKVKHVQTLQR